MINTRKNKQKRSFSTGTNKQLFHAGFFRHCNAAVDGHKPVKMQSAERKIIGEKNVNREEMIEYLLEELKEEEIKMLQSKENKYGYIFMLCNDMGIIPDE